MGMASMMSMMMNMMTMMCGAMNQGQATPGTVDNSNYGNNSWEALGQAQSQSRGQWPPQTANSWTPQTSNSYNFSASGVQPPLPQNSPPTRGRGGYSRGGRGRGFTY